MIDMSMYKKSKHEMLNQYKIKKTGKVHIKVTVRRVRVTTIAVEERSVLHIQFSA